MFYVHFGEGKIYDEDKVGYEPYFVAKWNLQELHLRAVKAQIAEQWGTEDEQDESALADFFAAWGERQEAEGILCRTRKIGLQILENERLAKEEAI